MIEADIFWGGLLCTNAIHEHEVKIIVMLCKMLYYWNKIVKEVEEFQFLK